MFDFRFGNTILNGDDSIGRTLHSPNRARIHDLHTKALVLEWDVGVTGHTHIPFKDKSLGMEVMNPGSIGAVKSPTYGVITIQDGVAKTEIKHLDKI